MLWQIGFPIAGKYLGHFHGTVGPISVSTGQVLSLHPATAKY